MASAVGPSARYTPPEQPRGRLLEKLCKYYLDCLGHDAQGGISMFATSKHGDPEYAELPCFPTLRDGSHAAAFATATSAIAKKAKADKNRLGLVVGYPVVAEFVRAKSGWEGYFVKPLLLFGVEEWNGAGDLRIVDDVPELNYDALKTLLGSDGSPIVEEVVQLVEELGLGAAIGCPDVEELASTMRSIRSDWPWREVLDPNRLTTNPPLARVASPGLYNRAVLVATEKSKYTKGLEIELTRLRSTRPEEYAGTALGAWLTSETGAARSVAESSEPLIEPIPLNTEQRLAVNRSLSRPLTVVTGPPGTGKSQVVTSILVNAAWRGQTVLFASKNNKAVDVVEVRANSLGPRPVLLRLGAQDKKDKLAEYIASVLAASASREDEDQYGELHETHQRLTRRSSRVEDDIRKVVELRNKVDELDKAIDALRESVGEDRFRRLREIDPSRARQQSDRFFDIARAADRSRRSAIVRLFWPLVSGRLEAAVQAAAPKIEPLAASLAVSLPSSPANEATIGEWVDAALLLKERSGDLRRVRDYYAALDALSSASAPEALSRELLDVVEQIARNSHEIWKLWLRLQPVRLSRQKREKLGHYSAFLKLLASGGRAWSKQNIEKQQTLFKDVAGSLPCWAVTSLSARGRLPLESGFFDLLVIDEASQCDIASALPLLFRAKRVVIIGDPQQLRHISAIGPVQDQRLLAKHDLTDELSWSYAVQSLFDRAASLAKGEDLVELRDHHRSHADIIGFANEKFYTGRLRVATHYDRLNPPARETPAVRWIPVRGRVTKPAGGGARNPEEAAAVVRELRRLVLEQGYRGTIGIVSPFRAQANLIRDLVNGDDDLVERLARADLLVDTVHRFQGDERDVMLFSSTLSQGASDGAISFLKRTPNLFNVAITRARAALVVFGDAEAASDAGVDYLAEFAAYCERVGLSPATPMASTATDLGPRYPQIPTKHPVSEWEHRLYEALYAAGLRPVPQYEVEQYALDLALFDGHRRLDIEVDGERYHRNWTGEHSRRDQLRNQRLMELGWDVQRFWVYQIRDDIEKCVARVQAWRARSRA